MIKSAEPVCYEICRESPREARRYDTDTLLVLGAGTGGYGLELVRELELYQQAGLTNEEALPPATIIPARTTGMADRFGSIETGKTASMILINGDASKDLGALRRVTTVFLDGYRLDGAALREASGFSGFSGAPK